MALPTHSPPDFATRAKGVAEMRETFDIVSNGGFAQLAQPQRVGEVGVLMEVFVVGHADGVLDDRAHPDVKRGDRL
ncbi:hypothetical protein AB0B25_31660 [Nocardia sp. NPDC049190]|uniref:hypothetical protein n=1 Tax=Nocardia sp. NPDC049190 TaxID=3155650 RepID=UPI0033CCF42C